MRSTGDEEGLLAVCNGQPTAACPSELPGLDVSKQTDQVDIGLKRVGSTSLQPLLLQFMCVRGIYFGKAAR